MSPGCGRRSHMAVSRQERPGEKSREDLTHQGMRSTGSLLSKLRRRQDGKHQRPQPTLRKGVVYIRRGWWSATEEARRSCVKRRSSRGACLVADVPQVCRRQRSVAAGPHGGLSLIIAQHGCAGSLRTWRLGPEPRSSRRRWQRRRTSPAGKLAMVSALDLRATNGFGIIGEPRMAGRIQVHGWTGALLGA